MARAKSSQFQTEEALSFKVEKQLGQIINERTKNNIKINTP